MTASTTRRTTAARSRIAAVGAIAVAGALLLTGCGDQTESKDASGDSTSKSTAPLAEKLPQAIRDKGVIKVGSDIAYAPVEFKDESGKTVGIDPDLADAMGKQLGVKFEFENGTFDTLLGGLRSDRYDIAMSAMTDTKDRQEGVDSATGKKVGQGSTSSTTSPPVSRSTPIRATTRASRPGQTCVERSWSSSAARSRTTWPGPRQRSARRARPSPLSPSTTTSRPRPVCARAAPTPVLPTSPWPRTR